MFSLKVFAVWYFDQFHVFLYNVILTPKAQTPLNGETNSDNSLPKNRRIFLSVFDHFVELMLKGVNPKAYLSVI